jgi:hypothetical protein
MDKRVEDLSPEQIGLLSNNLYKLFHSKSKINKNSMKN